MLVSVTLSNWMSFRDPVRFFMMAGDVDCAHQERVSEAEKLPLRVLPVTAIYGGNASGKSNFIAAVRFVKLFVTSQPKRSTSLIPVKPFLLDAKTKGEPSTFELKLLIHERFYIFSFTATQEKVVEERLVEVAQDEEIPLYHRRDEGIELGCVPDEDRNALNTVYEKTLKNQLFLQSSIAGKMKIFRDVYDWFDQSLLVVSPNMGVDIISIDNSASKMLVALLSQLDTGISRINGRLTQEILEGVETKESILSSEDCISKSNSEHAEKRGENVTSFRREWTTSHVATDGSLVEFSKDVESDGSRRLVELSPLFLLMSKKKDCVVLIDELDRSLHTHVTWQLVEMYLKSCSKESRKQLIFTTHDVMLIDHHLLRLDEIWVSERDKEGCSQLVAFSYYKALNENKDAWRQLYLEGRMGGIPDLPIDMQFPPDDDRKSGGEEKA